MSKHEKQIGVPSVNDRKRLPAPQEPTRKKTRRHVNFEAREESLHAKIAAVPWWGDYFPLAEEAARRKQKKASDAKRKCTCGHRLPKHQRYAGRGRQETTTCSVCPRGECKMFNEIPHGSTGAE